MEDIKVEKMTLDDIKQVLKFGSQEVAFTTGEKSGCFWTSEEIKKVIKSENDVLFVAKSGNELVGFVIVLVHTPTGKATLENIWTHPEYKKKGIGTMLINKVINKLKDMGCSYICGFTTDSNEPMISLFEKMGFDKGYKFYWMEKLI